MVQPTRQRPSVHLWCSGEEGYSTIRLFWKWHTCQLCDCWVGDSILAKFVLLETKNFSKHDHTIPGVNLPTGFLVDYTDRGHLWDPVLNAYSYIYKVADRTFEAASPGAPLGLVNFNGKWGDDQPPNEPSIFGEAKYVAGPNGPKFKSLDRKHVCPSTPCIVLPFRIWSGQKDSWRVYRYSMVFLIQRWRHLFLSDDAW